MTQIKGWTDEQVNILMQNNATISEIAQALGKTKKSIRCARERLQRRIREGKIDPGSFLPPITDKIPATPSHKDDKHVIGESYWKTRCAQIETEYKKALKENVLVDRLIADIKSVAPLSYSAAPKQFIESKRAAQTPESAVLLFSDSHVGKVVRREQTLGFAQYDFPTFLARLKFLERGVISILEDHTNSPVEELVIPMMGDMLDGALSHGSEAGQRNTLFSQFYSAGHAIAQFLRNLSARVPKIRMYTCVGNHTRWMNQKKMPSENRFSNLDSFLYVFIEALTKGIPNIEWHIDEQPFAIFKVQGFTFFASHGDNLKGGDVAFGLPTHSMARQMNATTQLFHKHGAEVPDYYVMGHFHRPIQIPTGLGDFTVNGGFPGLDGYALTGNFNPVSPSQTFFRVHKKFGKIAQYQLQLKFAELGKSTYDIPKEFLCE